VQTIVPDEYRIGGVGTAECAGTEFEVDTKWQEFVSGTGRRIEHQAKSPPL
jgi:hypothetical protein